jgi:hypothetical protein
MVRGLVVWLAAACLAGCSSIRTGGVKTASTVSAPGGAARVPAPPGAGASPTTAAVTPGVFDLSRALPAEGIAVESHGVIQVLDLNGGEVGTITDASLVGAGEPSGHDLTVHDSTHRYRLAVGHTTPTADASTSAPLNPFGCHDAVGSGATLVICNDSTYEAEPTISLKSVNGMSRVVGSPFPKVAGRFDGFWEWAQLSPNGRWVLGQWSGECEVPDAFLMPAAGGSPQTFDASPLAHPRQSLALGWTTSGEAVVWLQSGVCGTGSPSPGVYRAQPGGSLQLIVAAHDTATIVMWS